MRLQPVRRNHPQAPPHGNRKVKPGLNTTWRLSSIDQNRSNDQNRSKSTKTTGFGKNAANINIQQIRKKYNSFSQFFSLFLLFLSDYPGPVVSDHSGPVVSHHSGPVVSDHSGPVVSDHSGPVVSHTTSPVVPHTTSPVVPHTTSPVVSDHSGPEWPHHSFVSVRNHFRNLSHRGTADTRGTGVYVFPSPYFVMFMAEFSGFYHQNLALKLLFVKYCADFCRVLYYQ
jgi:hypothetical protein